MRYCAPIRGICSITGQSLPSLKTRFIVNPHSGRAARALPAVQAFATAHLAEVVRTAGPRHAAELAARAIADGCELVVSVGGDGTMNEIAAVLMDRGVMLGLVPCGSGDGLALSLGIPRAVPRALQVLLTGRPRSIDTAQVNGRPFFNAVGLGYEADIAQRFAGFRSRGLLGYVRAGVPLFFTRRQEPVTVHHDRGRATLTIWSLAVQNSEQLGNNLITAPGARVDDGRLDLVATAPVSLLGAVGLAARIATDTIDRARGITWLRSAHFVIERRTAGLIHTDGEPREADARLEISVRPRSLRVMVPTPDEPAYIPVAPGELAGA